jgi:hypothetical protein
VLETFFSTLAVQTDSTQFRWSKALPQTQIGTPQNGELLQRITQIDLVVAKSIGPQVLIVAGERGAVLRENETDAKSSDELGVCKVLNDVANRPFARRLRRRVDVWVQRADECGDGDRRVSKNDDRVLIAQPIEQRAHVTSGLCGC